MVKVIKLRRFRCHKTPMNTRELIRSASSGFSTGPMRCLRGLAWTRQWPPRGLSKSCAASRSMRKVPR